MAQLLTAPDKLKWSDVLLARNTRNPRATAIQVLLILAWHWIVLAGTVAVNDWLLGYGASTNGIAAQPNRLDIGRALDFFVQPIAATAMLTLLLIEGLLSWVTFRLATRRVREPFGKFIRHWWRICLWGTVVLPVPAILFAAFTRNYDAAMNAPLLWIVCGIVGPTVLFKLDSNRRYSPGLCQKCGYDLTGNVSGRCPECGVPSSQPPNVEP